MTITGRNIAPYPVNMVEYYLSKITSMVDYLVSILVVFSVGHWSSDASRERLGLRLMIAGSVALWHGLTLTLPSSQLMFNVGNLLT